MSPMTTHTPRPKVLIVEPDRELAMAMMRACLELGLEPKLCLGDQDGSCPATCRADCPRGDGAHAVLVATPALNRPFHAATCAGMAPAIISTPRQVPTGISDKLTIKYPYVPADAALLLAFVARAGTVDL